MLKFFLTVCLENIFICVTECLTCTGQESDAKNCSKAETAQAKKRLFDRLSFNENYSQNTRMSPLTFHDDPEDVIYFDPAIISVDLYVTSITNVVCVQ